MRTVGPADLQEITAALSARDPGIVQWKLIEDGPVQRLDVHVADGSLCAFSIEVEAKGGQDYGFYFGHGAGFESLDPKEFEPLALVAAVIKGNVRERVWRLGSWYVTRNEAQLILPDGRVLRDSSVPLPWLWRLASMHEIAYQPYPIEPPM